MGKNGRHAAIAVLLVTAASAALSGVGELRITSPSFEQNAVIPSQFTCDGPGMNPALRFGGIPGAAKSLVFIVYDPDVPKAIKSDGRYLHWALWDLSPDTPGIVERHRAQGLNENGPGGYIPPCPPNGEHRSVFQLYALDTRLGDTRIAREGDLRRAMEGHVLDQNELVGRYTTRMFRIVRFGLAVVALLVAFFVIRRLIARRAQENVK